MAGKRPYNRKVPIVSKSETVLDPHAEVRDPSANFTETPEFQDAVAAAAKLAAEQLLAPMLARISDNPTSVSGSGDKTLMQELALCISELTNQGSVNRKVPPDVMAKRNAARELMGKLIMSARDRGAKPRYRALNKCVLNERMIEPYRRNPDNNRMVPTEFSWTGVPNECMYPLDDDAHAIFQAFRDSIGSVVEGPALNNKPLWMTAAGLVIQGDPPQSLKVGNDRPAENVKRFGDDLGLSVANDPEATHVAILGTLAAPARQNFAGDRSGRA